MRVEMRRQIRRVRVKVKVNRTVSGRMRRTVIGIGRMRPPVAPMRRMEDEMGANDD